MLDPDQSRETGFTCGKVGVVRSLLCSLSLRARTRFGRDDLLFALQKRGRFFRTSTSFGEGGEKGVGYRDLEVFGDVLAEAQ